MDRKFYINEGTGQELVAKGIIRTSKTDYSDQMRKETIKGLANTDKTCLCSQFRVLPNFVQPLNYLNDPDGGRRQSNICSSSQTGNWEEVDPVKSCCQTSKDSRAGSAGKRRTNQPA